jgi:hypothetical protein
LRYFLINNKGNCGTGRDHLSAESWLGGDNRLRKIEYVK